MYFSNSHAEPRLADAGDADDREQVGTPLVGRRVEQLLQQAQLAIAADERRLEPDRAALAASVGDDPERLPERHGLGLALQLVLAGVGVGDGGLGRAARGLADEDGAGLGGGLDAGGGVDEVAGDHALVGRAEGDGGLAGERRRRGPGARGRAPGTASTSSSAARTARSASSSCAMGAPQTAITASPMNFSTVPP